MLPIKIITNSPDPSLIQCVTNYTMFSHSSSYVIFATTLKRQTGRLLLCYCIDEETEVPKLRLTTLHFHYFKGARI